MKPVESITVELEQDEETGELILPLDPDTLKQMGWDVGDTILWEEHNDGTWTLTKQDNGNKDA